MMASPPDDWIEIQLDRPPSFKALVAVLNVWQDLGIVQEDSVVCLLKLDRTHPQFLAGLEAGLQLGFIDPRQVEQIARNYLCCLIPAPQLRAPVERDWREPQPTVVTASPRSPQPSWISQRLEALKAELSVRWLLFLGLFLVVLSSGVFAASQWENFPAVVQYGVLLAYTSLFGLISHIASQRENLRLTTQALTLVTLLLIPVNFWAMDGFGLWSHPLNALVSLGSAVYLTAIARSLWQENQVFPFPFLLYLLVSYLHWGWGIPYFPVLGIYGASIISLGVYYSLWRNSTISWGNSLEISRLSLYAVSILLFRAIFVQGVWLSSLGLAIALWGLFLIWLSQTRIAPTSPLLNRAGILVLLGGWLCSLWVELPWPGVVISWIALRVFNYFLKRYWHFQDLIVIWLIGAQFSLLLWNLIPAIAQKQIITLSLELTQAQNSPFALLSLIGIPYLIWMLQSADDLYRQSQTQLAQNSESIALALGLVLLRISFDNDLLRIWCLTNLIFLIIWVTKRRYELQIFHALQFLVYLNHLMGLGLIFSLIHYSNPQLTLPNWAILSLGILVIEWWFSDLRRLPVTGAYAKIWQNSAWIMGLGLAAIAYTLFVTASMPSVAYLTWFTVPFTLTLMSYAPHSSRQKLATQLSIASLLAVQYLTMEITGWRVLGLAIATVLMAFNTDKLPYTAFLTIGYSLLTLGLGLWDLIPGMATLTLSPWFTVSAITITSLWIIRNYTYRSGIAHKNYTQALEGWAIALCLCQLILLTRHSLLVYYSGLTPEPHPILSLSILLGAIVYRSLPGVSNGSLLAIGWTIELLTIEILALRDAPPIALAIANLMLGLVAQWLGSWWQRRSPDSHLTLSWQTIPLGYGILGALFRWGIFSHGTGITTLALGIIVIGVGRQTHSDDPGGSPPLKPLIYLGIIGISASAYETLAYQLSLHPQGSIGDGLIILATLGTTLLYAYRLLGRFGCSYLHLTPQEYQWITHGHWLGSSLLLIVATAYPITATLSLGLGTGTLLVLYAISSARYLSSSQGGEAWIYAGFAEGVGIRFYWLHSPLAEILGGPLVPFQGAIATICAYFLYFLPWSTWGWIPRPWQLAGIWLPLYPLIENFGKLNPISFLVIAAYYLGLALINQQIRFTYLSLTVINGMIGRWLFSLGITEIFLYLLLPTLSLLYIIHIDPFLRAPPSKNLRHRLRLFICTLLCLVSFATEQWIGTVTGSLSLLMIFAGLSLKIRAFLSIGTATFMLNLFYQFGILILDYPFSKWLVALGVGIALIWIGATFETRREQIQAWFQEVQHWE